MSRLIAAILTRNEALVLQGCIESIRPLTNEIIVLDSGSSDRTVAIGRELGARVIELGWPGFPAQRNAALEIASDAEWLLFLDADERLTPRLRREIGDALATAGAEEAGFMIPRRNVIAGHIMRGGGWWPDYQARVLRPTRCRYDLHAAVHEVPDCGGALFALNTPIVHLNYPTWGAFLRKQIGYERVKARSSGLPRRRAYIGAPLREFASRFIGQRGYRDGIHGFIACAILALVRLYGVWLIRWKRS